MSDTPTEPTAPSDPTPAPEPPKADEGKTFTQADVDRIVADRVKRVEAKFADYDDLKAKADSAKALEDRVADVESQANAAEARALRAEIANAKGLTPGQAKRLVGDTRDELEADADQLIADIGAQRSNGNHVPNEGNNPKPGSDEVREFTRGLFGRATAD